MEDNYGRSYKTHSVHLSENQWKVDNMNGGFCVVCMLCVTLVDCVAVNYHRDIYTAILRNYTKEVRPISTTSMRLDISVFCTLISINDFDEVTGMLTILAVLSFRWRDEALVWNPIHYGNMTWITIPKSNIWTPEIYNVRAADFIKPFGEDSDFRVVILNSGHAHTSPGGILKVKCTPNVTRFPFDVQTCFIDLMPWMYSPNEIQLVSASPQIDLSYYTPNREWALIDTGTTSEVEGQHSAIKLMLKMKRKPLYHLVNTLIPVYMLLFLNPLVFLLPCESGERSGYSLTILLAYTVFMLVISSSLPQISDPTPVLSTVTFGALLLSGTITALNNFQLRMYHKDSRDPVPMWLVHLILRIWCFRKRQKVMRDATGAKNDSSQRDTLNPTTNPGNVYLNTCTVDDITPSGENRETLTWKQVACFMDVLYLCVIYTLSVTATIGSLVFLTLT